MYEGATHHARPPFSAASRHSALPSIVLPHRRPQARTRKRASLTLTCFCAGWSGGRWTVSFLIPVQPHLYIGSVLVDVPLSGSAPYAVHDLRRTTSPETGLETFVVHELDHQLESILSRRLNLGAFEIFLFVNRAPILGALGASCAWSASASWHLIFGPCISNQSKNHSESHGHPAKPFEPTPHTHDTRQRTLCQAITPISPPEAAASSTPRDTLHKPC